MARRWVVEGCANWFCRFRKLLVRCEKLERSVIALNHLDTATVAFGKVQAVKVIHGKFLSWTNHRRTGVIEVDPFLTRT